MKKWIRLFSLNDRAWLEQSLNEFIRDHEDCEINVWIHEGIWCAQVRYSFSEAPTYTKPEIPEEI